MKKLIAALLFSVIGCSSGHYVKVVDCRNFDSQKRKVVKQTPWGQRTYWATPCGGGFWLYERTKP